MLSNETEFAKCYSETQSNPPRISDMIVFRKARWEPVGQLYSTIDGHIMIN